MSASSILIMPITSSDSLPLVICKCCILWTIHLAPYPGLPLQFFSPQSWKKIVADFFHGCKKSCEGRPGYEATVHSLCIRLQCKQEPRIHIKATRPSNGSGTQSELETTLPVCRASCYFCTIWCPTTPEEIL